MGGGWQNSTKIEGVAYNILTKKTFEGRTIFQRVQGCRERERFLSRNAMFNPKLPHLLQMSSLSNLHLDSVLKLQAL